MKIKNQKLLIGILGALFVVLLVLYFAVIRPLTKVETDTDAHLELIHDEVPITAKTSNFYIFQPLERASIQSIEVENEFGGYKVYRDAADAFQLDGFYGLSFDPELFSSLVVTTGTPTAMMRVATDLDSAGLAEYGLDKPQASWTVTSTTGETYKMFVGDNLITEGGYYVSYEKYPDTVYILSNTLADTVLKPAYGLLQPLLTAGMSQNNYFFVGEFTVMHGEDLFVHVERVPEDQMSSPDAIVEVKLTYPRPSEGDELYQINDNLYYQILYNFMALQGESVVAFMPTDEQLEEFGLATPAYTIFYTFEDYDFYIFVSEQQKDGTYYATSNLYGYSTVCQVSGEYLNWLEGDEFTWIFPTPFFENITEVSRITLYGEGIDVDFRLTHSKTAEDTPILDVEEVKSGVKIPNEEVKNFREYYKTMLNITNQEYATLSEEDVRKLIEDESQVFLTMTYEKPDGQTNVYQFFRYYESSTGHISGGKVFVVVNGVGEFYTTNDLVEKVVNDTPRVLNGLDIDAYGHN